MTLVKSAHVNMAARAPTERAALVEQCRCGTMNVLINARYQDDDMVARVRPVIVDELQRRVAAIDADLMSWGVEPPRA